MDWAVVADLKPCGEKLYHILVRLQLVCFFMFRDGAWGVLLHTRRGEGSRK
jgi:hypothetical protein